MIRSPLRYPGGKSRAVEKISALIPPFDEFREPFVGGGSIFIYLKQKFPHKKFWINDKYAELATFWRGLQNDSEKVIKQIHEKPKEEQKTSIPSGFKRVLMRLPCDALTIRHPVSRIQYLYYYYAYKNFLRGQAPFSLQ